MTQPKSQNLVQWLQNDAPTSVRQAMAGNLYRGLVSVVSNPAALAGLMIIFALILMALFAPQLAGNQSPISQSLADRLQPPNAVHWFGTDELGRDIYARTLYGARVTISMVLLVSVIVGPVGLAFGTHGRLHGGLGGCCAHADH